MTVVALPDPELSILDRLSAPWPAEDVKTRKQAGQDLYYISIDQTLQRWLEVFGVEWSIKVTDVKVFETIGKQTTKEYVQYVDEDSNVVYPNGDGEFLDENKKPIHPVIEQNVRDTTVGKSTFTAFVAVEITYTVDGIQYACGGVGGATATDADQAVKSAFAEGAKKASNTRGLALYLWEKEERAKIAAETNPAAKKAALKQEVLAKYKKEAKTTKVDRKEMAMFFGVDESELDNVDVLKKILEG